MTYRIVRFFKQKDKVYRAVQKTGLSLEDAQKHCQSKYTEGEGWFDGYEKED
jgi:hypothetical protein